jgi:hypothetical protein
MMVKNTHLKNRPWEKTLKEKGKNAYIDYFLEIDDLKIKKEFQDNIDDRSKIEKAFK